MAFCHNTFKMYVINIFCQLWLSYDITNSIHDWIDVINVNFYIIISIHDVTMMTFIS